MCCYSMHVHKHICPDFVLSLLSLIPVTFGSSCVKDHPDIISCSFMNDLADK